MDPALQELVRAHQPHLVVTDEGKIKCELNGHTFPPKLELVQAFLSGAKYRKLVARAEAEAALPKYDPFLVPSVNFPDKLFCALTNQLISRSLDAVKQHMKGKRFQKAKDRFQEDKQELFEEPNLAEAEEGDAMEEDGAGEGADLGIWIPEGVESSDEEGAGIEEGAEGEDAGDDSGPSGSGGEEAMEEEPPAQQQPQQAKQQRQAGRRKGGQAAAQPGKQPAAGAEAAAGGQRGKGKRQQGPAAEQNGAAAKKGPAGKKGAPANGDASKAKGKQAARPSRAKKPRTAQ